ncbi:MAG TPA: radical SAM family heme chaperone HemW, partial [Vicinamibacterales bacterium]|nr:radical SAM family heme chaperone HemW [Vicinamibacterales bacterium]
NFNRGLFDADLKARYVEALVAEIGGTQDAPAHASADTIYFGGGTPSLLEPGEIARVIGACRARFDVAAGAEVTMEANPESVTTERLAAYRAAGVNRVSFGVQSFRDEELVRLSRLHGADRARSAMLEARDAGFDNVSLDLMMWLPGQSVGQWLESVDRATAAAPDHMSLYMLEVYPNAPLRDEMARRQWSQAPDEDVASMYMAAMERLDASGFEQYEISNVAKPGRTSRHNLKYWTDGEWLGFGCGAHSTSGGARWKNLADTEEYVARVAAGTSPAVDRRTLATAEKLGDALFTGLRLSGGVDLPVMGLRYGVDIWQRYGADLAPFVEEGLLLHEGPRLWLTRRGMLLAHEVMAVFV